jgi:hypothetical protein
MAYHGGTQQSTLGYFSKAGSNVQDSQIICSTAEVILWHDALLEVPTSEALNETSSKCFNVFQVHLYLSVHVISPI